MVYYRGNVGGNLGGEFGVVGAVGRYLGWSILWSGGVAV